MTRSFRGALSPERKTAHRRAAVALAGAAAAATLLLSGCSAGQIAETAAMAPTVHGVNAQSADNAFKIRNLTIEYLNTEGYPTGGDVPTSVVLYNDSERAVTVRVSTTGARSVVLAGGEATPTPQAPTPTPTAEATESPSGDAAGTPTPTPTTTPEAPAPTPAEIQIPAGEFVVLSKTAGRWLQLSGLNEPLAPGQSVEMTFDFGGTTIDTAAPVAVPLVPAPTATAVVNPEEGHEG